MNNLPLTQVLLIQPFDQNADAVFQMVQAAGIYAGVEVKRFDQLAPSEGTLTETMQSAVARACLIVADLTNANPNVMFEFGLATAQEKPVVVIGQGIRSIPPTAARLGLFVSYELPDKSNSFELTLGKWIKKLIADPAGETVRSLVALRISADRGRSFQPIADGISDERGRRFRLIVDDVSA